MDIIKDTLKAPWYEPSKDQREDSNVWHNHIYTKDDKWLFYLDHDHWINDGGITQDEEVVRLVKIMIKNLPELWELLHHSYLLMRSPTFTDNEIPILTREELVKRCENLTSLFLDAAKPIQNIKTSYSDDDCYTPGEQNLAVRLDCQTLGDAHPCHA